MIDRQHNRIVAIAILGLVAMGAALVTIGWEIWKLVF
jgi:hypothetical protein